MALSAQENSPGKLKDSEIETFDLESYISSYTGHTKVNRLKFIAGTTKSKEIARDAYRIALKVVKEGQNTSLYKELISKASKVTGLEFPLDTNWIDGVDKRAAQRQEKLESELNGYKTNLIKESIRMGYNDLAEFFYHRGELQQAFKCYVRTRDYCTTPKHIISMCLNVILVSSELGQFINVSNYVQKAEQTPDVQNPVVLAKLKCASGLASLEAKKYKLAGRKFVETGFELGSDYSEVIAPQDVATYGGLCALASFDRAELKSKVIDNLVFKNFLELVPEVRELIHDFYASRYASCLEYLEKLKPTLAMDIHLHDHVETLYQQIRHKALIQYTTPFISVDLRTMADAFTTDVASLEKELAALITENQIQARIDSHQKILFARHADQRNVTFQRAIQVGEDYQENTKAMLIRSSLTRNDIYVKGWGGKSLQSSPFPGRMP